MKILADENIDYPIIKLLREEGFEVFSIFEENRSVNDQTVLEIANQLNAILLTNDKDFGDLVIRQRLPHKGIILLRLTNKNLAENTQIIINVLKTYHTQLSNQFTVIRDKHIKIRLF